MHPAAKPLNARTVFSLIDLRGALFRVRQTGRWFATSCYPGSECGHNDAPAAPPRARAALGQYAKSLPTDPVLAILTIFSILAIIRPICL